MENVHLHVPMQLLWVFGVVLLLNAFSFLIDMRRIFWIYIIWHIILLLFQFDYLELPKGSGKIFGCVMVLNLFYISFAPFYNVINSIKGDHSELQYMKICIAMIPSRFIIMALGVLGGESIVNILACEVLVLPCYFIYNKYIANRVSDSAIFEALRKDHD